MKLYILIGKKRKIRLSAKTLLIWFGIERNVEGAVQKFWKLWPDGVVISTIDIPLHELLYLLPFFNKRIK